MRQRLHPAPNLHRALLLRATQSHYRDNPRALLDKCGFQKDMQAMMFYPNLDECADEYFCYDTQVKDSNAGLAFRDAHHENHY